MHAARGVDAVTGRLDGHQFQIVLLWVAVAVVGAVAVWALAFR